MTTTTEDWDFYLCNVEQKIASIYVDLGAIAMLPMTTHSLAACLRLFMLSPRDDGMSSSQEYDQLVAIEDALQAMCASCNTFYVGRCTSNGSRDFYYYTGDAVTWQARAEECLRAFPGYRYEISSHEDADWSTYRTFLYPGDADRQSIENRRVCSALERHGDTLALAREIDHWAEFANATTRDAFVTGALTLGFAVRGTTMREADGKYWAQVFREDIPGMGSIDAVIRPLYDLALQFEGSYDGWESVVVRAEPPGSVAALPGPD